MGKVMLATGLIVAYGYGIEVFMSYWYSASHWEYFMMWNRMFGPMGWSYWVLITCNIALPQLMWLQEVPHRMSASCSSCRFIVNTGMWFERFVIVVTSLYRDYLPSSWGTYGRRAGTTRPLSERWACSRSLFFLFIRFLPMIPMSEIRMMLPQAKIRPEAELPHGGR